MEELNKYKKQKRKKTSTFTIDINVLNEFDEFAKKNGINKSKLVEDLIKEFLQKQKI